MEPKTQSKGCTLYSLLPPIYKAEAAREEFVKRGFRIDKPYRIMQHGCMVLMIQKTEVDSGGHETPVHKGEGGK